MSPGERFWLKCAGVIGFFGVAAAVLPFFGLQFQRLGNVAQFGHTPGLLFIALAGLMSALVWVRSRYPSVFRYAWIGGVSLFGVLLALAIVLPIVNGGTGGNPYRPSYDFEAAEQRYREQDERMRADRAAQDAKARSEIEALLNSDRVWTIRFIPALTEERSKAVQTAVTALFVSKPTSYSVRSRGGETIITAAPIDDVNQLAATLAPFGRVHTEASSNTATVRTGLAGNPRNE